eukprot:Ihof_evm3s493 gene=Ihof_evmTU3s493
MQIEDIGLELNRVDKSAGEKVQPVQPVKPVSGQGLCVKNFTSNKSDHDVNTTWASFSFDRQPVKPVDSLIHIDTELINQAENCKTNLLCLFKYNLPGWRMIGIGILGLAVEFCWAVGEALIIPYLVGLGLHVEYAGLVWLANPVITLLFQPVLGALSDRCTSTHGRRRPFILGLTILGSLGILLLVYIPDMIPNNPTGILACSFVSYALADIAHNCLVGFGRMIIGDLFNQSQLETAHATFSFLQMSGRLLALIAGISNIAILFPMLTSHAHTRSLFLLSLLVLIVGCVVTCLAANEKPYDPPSVSLSTVGDEIPSEHCPLIRGSDDKLTGSNGSFDFFLPRVASEPGSISSESTARTKPSGRSRPWYDLPLDLYLLLAISVIGWTAFMAQGFYWTDWIGLNKMAEGTNIRVAFLTLIVYAVASMITVFTMPFLNKLGPLPVLILGEILLMVSMVLTMYATNLAMISVVMATSGVAYAIHTNNTFILCDHFLKLGEEDRRGYYSSLVNATLTAGQILVGAFA